MIHCFFPSRAPLQARLWLAGAAPASLGVSLALVAPRIAWAQGMPQEMTPSSMDGAISVTNPDIGDQIMRILPFAEILMLMLVILLCWFIFRKPTTARGKAAAQKQDIENHESFIA